MKIEEDLTKNSSGLPMNMEDILLSGFQEGSTLKESAFLMVDDEDVPIENISIFEKILRDLAKTERMLQQPLCEKVEPVLLQKELKEIIQKNSIDLNKQLTPKEQQALSERWKMVKETRQWDELTRRDLRDLVSIPEAFCDPVLLTLIKGQRPFNKRFLTTILKAYLSHWQSLKALRSGWSSLIAEALELPEFKQLTWPAFQQWRKIAHWLLADNASEKLAKDLIHSSGPLPAAVNSYLQIDVGCPEGSLGEHSRQFLLAGLLQLNHIQIREYLTQALQHWVNPLNDHDWLSKLILTVHNINDEVLIEQVKAWLLRAQGFGDVRLNPDSLGWRRMTMEARQTFTGWLSKEDLEFFFKMVLPERDDPHKRREFWEQYLPCVIRSRVLISDQDEWRNKDALNEMKKKGKTLPGSIRNSSVFIMETKYCYILEFSEVGNAAFIYWINEKKLYPRIHEKLEQLLKMKGVGDLSSNALKVKTSEIAQLSNSDSCTQNYSIRCIHSSNWQQALRRWLNLRGIRP